MPSHRPGPRSGADLSKSANLGCETEKFLTRDRVLAKATQHSAGNEIGACFVDAASRHAMVRRLYDNGDALRFQHFMDHVSDLSGHFLLDLQPLGEHIDHACKLTDANHAAIRNVAHPRLANDRRHVVLTMALKRNAAQRDHFVVAFDFLERFLKDLCRILSVAREKLLKCANYARRRLCKTVTPGIVSGPLNNRSNRSLNIRSSRAIDFVVGKLGALKGMNVAVHQKSSVLLAAYAGH